MKDESAVVRWGNRAIGVLIVLNLIGAAMFALAAIGTVVWEPVLFSTLSAKYGGRADEAGLVWALRGLMTAAVIAALPVDRCLRALRGVVASIREGDPFDPRNARRATTIGWALLAIQLLDLGFGAIVWLIARTGADAATWQPSVGGWLSVLVAFVLARVFAAGARLRDDLEGTV
jgi:hypothetical protein